MQMVFLGWWVVHWFYERFSILFDGLLRFLAGGVVWFGLGKLWTSNFARFLNYWFNWI